MTVLQIDRGKPHSLRRAVPRKRVLVVADPEGRVVAKVAELSGSRSRRAELHCIEMGCDNETARVKLLMRKR